MSAKRKRSRRKNPSAAGAETARPAGTPVRAQTISGWPALVAVTGGLVILGLAVYWQVLGHRFVNFDDIEYVTQNSRIQRGFTAESVSWAFTTTYEGNWHPLTWLSHMLDYRLYGLNAAGHHLTSLLLHLANGLLLLWLLVRMTGSVWRSGAVAALFIAHPLHVESVAWVSERKDVLSACFWLLTTLAYSHYVRRVNAGRYALVLLTFALGLMAKPMLVSLPITLLLLDCWPLARQGSGNGRLCGKWAPLISEKLPLFALSAASSAITLVAQRTGGLVASVSEYPLGLRLANAAVAYVTYLLKTVWPSGLACLYPYVKDPPAWQVAGSAVFLAVVTVLAIGMVRRSRYLAVGWLWYLVTLLPVIGLVQVGLQSRADRYTYVPLIGVFVMIAWGVPDLVDRLTSGRGPARRLLNKRVLSASAIAVIVALAWSARVQASYWRDSVTLLERALAVTRNNDVAHYNLGRTFEDQGKLDQAAAQYAAALAINPRYLECHYNLANVLAKRGDFDEAATHYSAALNINPEYAPAHNNLAYVLFQMGRLQDAARHFSEAIRISPNCARYHIDLSVVLYKLGDYVGAWRELQIYRQLGGVPDPDFVRKLSEAMPNPER